MSDALLEIETLISQGNPKKANVQLKTYLRKSRLKIDEKIRISEIYRSLSENEKALKILGQELSINEMSQVTDEELSLQVRLAYMLQYLGVRYVAERIFKTFEEVAKKRNLPITKMVPQYNRYLSGLYLGRNNYLKALDASEKAIKDLENDMKGWKASVINKVAALFSLRRYQECEDFIHKVMRESSDGDSIFKGECYQRLADLYLDQNNLDKAHEAIQKGLPLLQETQTSDYIFIHRSLIIWSSKKGLKKEALEAIKKCEDFAHYGQAAAAIRISILYWKEYHLSESVPVAERVASRAHLTYSPYSFALGKTYPVDQEVPLRTFFGSSYTPSLNDVWCIHQGKIRPLTYKEAVRMAQTHPAVIDLVSGLEMEEGNVLNMFTALQSQTISALLGAGELGLSKWLLVDFLYRQDFFNPKSGEDRLKKLISSLKKLGYGTTRDSNLLKLPLPENKTIIMPMNHSYSGPWAYLLATKESFSRADLEVIYKIKTSTAKQWIDIWEKEGVIISVGTGKSVRYLKAK